MWDFIVSGRLPGTAIQISFEHWLYSMAALAGLVMLAVLMRRHVFSRLLVKVLVMYAIVLTGFDSPDLPVTQRRTA